MYLKMFKNIGNLGEGGFGYVYLGQHFITQETVAIKIMLPNFIEKANEANNAFKEALLLQ